MFTFTKNLVFYWLIERLSLEGAALVAAFLFGVVLCIVVPYLLGSLNGSIIISKHLFNDDIRKYGSGNAGSTNMLRTYGKAPAIATLVFDMLKGVIAMFFGILVFGNVEFGSICGLFVVLGHMFPCFSRFKGGKGVATTAAVILMTNPIVFLILIVAFLIIVIGTKMISLGSVMCSLLYPLILYRFSLYRTWDVIVAFIIMALVVFMHRANIKRIWEGKESKISFKKHEKIPATPETEKIDAEMTDTVEQAAPKRATPDKNTSKKKLKNQKKQGK